MNTQTRDVSDTARPEYTKRLKGAQGPLAALKQLPYRLHLRALRLGYILDLGCGIGRNLAHNGGRGVGIDHNPTSVCVARERGLVAFTPEDFTASPRAAESFDAILCAHVAEHFEPNAFKSFVNEYLALLASGGRFVLITPQRRGFASDATHVTFIDFEAQRAVLEEIGLTIERQYSFPFPATFGNVFTYNEFVTIARKP